MLFDRLYFKLKKGQKENFQMGSAFTIMTIGLLVMGYFYLFGLGTTNLYLMSILSVCIGAVFTVFGFIFSDTKRGSTIQCLSPLITGLLFSVLFSTASGYIDFLPFVILTLILSEIFFWLDKRKPKKGDNVMEYTLWRKLDQIVESIILVGMAMTLFKVRDEIINVFGQIFNFFAQNFQFIIQILTWVGIIALIIGGSYAFIWVNSLKYRNTKKRKR